MLEHSGCDQMDFLALQHVDQCHLLLYRVEQLSDMLLVPLYLAGHVDFSFGRTTRTLLHDLQL